jgi:hypothetical protein
MSAAIWGTPAVALTHSGKLPQGEGGGDTQPLWDGELVQRVQNDQDGRLPMMRHAIARMSPAMGAHTKREDNREDQGQQPMLTHE